MFNLTTLKLRKTGLLIFSISLLLGANAFSMELIEQKAKRVKRECLKLTDLPRDIFYIILKSCFESSKDEQELKGAILSLPKVNRLFRELLDDKYILASAFKRLEKFKELFYLKELNLKYDPIFKNSIEISSRTNLLSRLQKFEKNKWHNMFEAKSRTDKNRLLLESATNGNLDLVVIALSNGADINAKNKEGDTALLCAASPLSYSNEEVVELLINKGADINPETKKGAKALHFVAGRGYKKALELLLSKGADVNAQDSYGQTALMEGIRRKDIVELLLSVPTIDTSLKRIWGGTVLDMVQYMKENSEAECRSFSFGKDKTYIDTIFNLIHEHKQKVEAQLKL